MTWIQTYTGRALDLLDPQPDQICAKDIAHALSMQCRFSGNSLDFYSVAEHSIRVAEIVEPDLRLEALLHDAAEAYVGDLPAPVKRLVPQFERIELRVRATIFAAFSAYEPPSEIKRADLVMLATEKRDLMAAEPKPWGELPDPLPETLRPWSQGAARFRYLRRLIREHERRIRRVS